MSTSAGSEVPRPAAQHRSERASLVGLSPKDVVDNVITALTPTAFIAPSYWIDPNTGNNYMLTVQTPPIRSST